MLNNTHDFFIKFEMIIDELKTNGQSNEALSSALDKLNTLGEEAKEIGIPFNLENYENILRKKTGYPVRILLPNDIENDEEFLYYKDESFYNLSEYNDEEEV